MKIMITGASGYFGTMLAARIREDIPLAEIIGMDVRAEANELSHDMKVVFGDARKKRVEDLFKTEGKIDVVVHLAREANQALGSEALMLANVYGTFHMLEIARKYGVRKFIFPSSSVVYGAKNDNPALIPESFPLLGNRDVPAIRDRVEADLICQTFSDSCHIGDNDLRTIVLRYAPIYRENAVGILTQYMKGDYVPHFMGFDPMFQITDEREVVESLMLAITHPDANGVYNVAGEIFMPLTRIIKHLGKKPFPLPEFLIFRKGRFIWSENLKFDPNYLKFAFTVDDSRIRGELGYDPSRLHR